MEMDRMTMVVKSLDKGEMVVRSLQSEVEDLRDLHLALFHGSTCTIRSDETDWILGGVPVMIRNMVI